MSSTAVNKNLPTHQAYQTQQAPCSISEALANLRVGIQNADTNRDERWWLKTGLVDFDEAFQGLRLGAITVLASRPSMGRSALALNIATNVGIFQKRPTLYLSLEMPVWQLTLRIASLLAEVEVSTLQEGGLTVDQDCKLSTIIGKARNAPLHLMHYPYIDMASLCQRVRAFAQDHNQQDALSPLSLLVIDDLGYADLQMKMSGDELTAAYENAMHLLKDLAVELNIAILLLSNVNPSAEERENKRPVFTDLPSTALARMSDALLFLYRDDVYHPERENRDRAELMMASNSFDVTGTVYLTTNLKYGRFGC
ncbi:DnaB-like helicase C-terminal domain-containing protein [Polynucleobacter sp. 78F-HAINBA]|uniref:DnaB-like helicase C-terminal domain-containing protein n=1 Tax=Polynucleobacter sp. 78F-HAINBA TaxID=2689099 RepID=UPI001C0B752D|nr:DnaB-like helicase C-terminal domain-containing protein [Polynucleobacter sp. 78F-HAINBA]MBU3591199.1 DnaB-like helicase C-terminal domain-containing protein [Polynucleobacter sp. 78F-HAINBA]